MNLFRMTENNIDFGKTEFTVKKLNVHYLPIKKLSTISLFFKDMTKKGLYLRYFSWNFWDYLEQLYADYNFCENLSIFLLTQS